MWAHPDTTGQALLEQAAALQPRDLGGWVQLWLQLPRGVGSVPCAGWEWAGTAGDACPGFYSLSWLLGFVCF